MLSKELWVPKISICDDTEVKKKNFNQQHQEETPKDEPKDCTLGNETPLPFVEYSSARENIDTSKPADKPTTARIESETAEAPPILSRVKRMEELTRTLALVAFIPGVLLLAATPCMVIPIFVFPTGNKDFFVTLMLVDWFVSLLLIGVGTFITNLHWYYDPENDCLRCTALALPRIFHFKSQRRFFFWKKSPFSYEKFDNVV